MMSALGDLIPSARHWPLFRRNPSSNSGAASLLTGARIALPLFFVGMEGSRIPSSRRGERYSKRRRITRARLAALHRSPRGSYRSFMAYNPGGSPAAYRRHDWDGRCGSFGAPPSARSSAPSRCPGTRPRCGVKISTWMRMFRNVSGWVRLGRLDAYRFGMIRDTGRDRSPPPIGAADGMVVPR